MKNDFTELRNNNKFRIVVDYDAKPEAYYIRVDPSVKKGEQFILIAPMWKQWLNNGAGGLEYEISPMNDTKMYLTGHVFRYLDRDEARNEGERLRLNITESMIKFRYLGVKEDTKDFSMARQA